MRPFTLDRQTPRFLVTLLVFSLAAIVTMPDQTAVALITGGEGNEPLRDPGWPAGADVIVNHPDRVAYWEGPPFGGGQWHAECRGNASGLNFALGHFAKLPLKTKRVVVRDGVGRSFWINPNREQEKAETARIDWIFMVWQPASWQQLQDMPARLRQSSPVDPKDGPPSQIDVYTGGNIRWADVVVPEGLEVIDERLEAHGFSLADGTVLEGRVTDLATGKPIAASAKLQRIESQSPGGYRYTPAGEAAADASGRWVIKNAPTGRHRIVIEADGYVPRIVGYAQFDEPGWHLYDGGLSRPATVSGQVTDERGQPLAEVEVRLDDVVPETSGRYDSPLENKTGTDAAGRFRFDGVAVGNTSVWVHKQGYCRPGLGPTIATPKEDLALQMSCSAQLRVTADFSRAERPSAYIVSLEPEGGSKIGSWGGSGHIDVSNQFSFSDVPPGKYVITGRPNPGSESQQAGPVTVELEGGETTEVTLLAK